MIKQMNAGRPKDLSKRNKILEAAKTLFLSQGYHGSSMNQIALEAGVTKLTIYNHFQDKTTLFACAIAETCEASISTHPIDLDQHSHFPAVLYQVCALVLNIVNLPEALKLEHLLLELAAEQNPLVKPFYNASHRRLLMVCTDVFNRAIELGFIQAAPVEKQTQLLLSLLLGHRHHEVLLGVKPVPTAAQADGIIREAIEIFLLKYQVKH